MLDLGCGSAQPIARYLAERGCTLTGIDTAPAMIALSAACLPTHTWQVADMRTLDLHRTFNGILAWDSFFHLSHTHQRAMFPIFARHAAPACALMFTTGTTHGTAIGTLQGEPLHHASLDPAEYRALLTQNHFTLIAHTQQDPTCTHHTIWLAQHRHEPPP